MREPLSNHHRRTAHSSSGSRLNRQATQSNSRALSQHGATGQQQIREFIDADNAPFAGIIGVAVICNPNVYLLVGENKALLLREGDKLILKSDTSQECPDDVNPRNLSPPPKDAPCAEQHLYCIRFRYYDFVQQEWKETDEEQRLDASAYWENTVGSGRIPTYTAGQAVAAFWDPQRGFFIPLTR